MKKATKPIGLDDNFREVFPGDEVSDADCVLCTVREAGDQMLVDELRARGWTVTCIKTQSL